MSEKLVENVANIIQKRANAEGRMLVAIDGRCASGKTTLAVELKQLLPCEVIHMDHFFLRPKQRTPERLSTPGENVDHERFLREVLLPLCKGEQVSYRPFDCQTGGFGEAIRLENKKVYIIEGAYACHVSLREYYDLRIFLDVSFEEQMRRIIVRNGEDSAEIFRSKWIPLEERYFEAFGIADMCDYCFTS